jgi:hypothetical protein
MAFREIQKTALQFDSHLPSKEEQQKTAILHFTKVAPAVGDAIAGSALSKSVRIDFEFGH